LTAERTVDAYVAALPPQQREVAQALREIVGGTAPDAKESIKWAQPVYEDHGPFAYFKAHRQHVTFGFWRGVEVDAGRGILETGGSKMAHVRLRTVADLDRKLLADFVKRAVELNREKGDPSRTR
jgi:hypothetical protein